MNADGSGRKRLTRSSFPDSQPSWSPSGGKTTERGTADDDVIDASDGERVGIHCGTGENAGVYIDPGIDTVRCGRETVFP